MEFEPVIGLEVHVQLNTNSKLFCSCQTDFGLTPNTQVCPICLGHPGVLPLLNKQALKNAIQCGIALNCSISLFSKFDRKNYFYPDLPKGYQISQFDKPICYEGSVKFLFNDKETSVGITRVHLEEDAGKLVHSEQGGNSGVDFNRGGIPLLEIVSEPDIRSPKEAYLYLNALKNIVQYLGISDCNMEEGRLRCDANISIRRKGQTKLGTKAEIKNMNSFRGVQKALAYEIERQEDILLSGETIVQETRLWNDDKGQTFSMRSKENAHDYRYFPEPDLVPIVTEQSTIDDLQKSLPELPYNRMNRFISDYSLSAYDADVLTSEKVLADYFEQCASVCKEYKIISNWIQTELIRELNYRKIALTDCPVTPQKLTDMIKLISDGTISGKIAKSIFAEMFESDATPQQIIEAKGLKQISDPDALQKIIIDIMAKNLKVVEEFKRGKEKSLGFLVGQVMKETRGKANPKLVNELLRNALK